jgi:hypothetical protein
VDVGGKARDGDFSWRTPRTMLDCPWWLTALRNSYVGPEGRQGFDIPKDRGIASTCSRDISFTGDPRSEDKRVNRGRGPANLSSANRTHARKPSEITSPSHSCKIPEWR